MHNLALVLSGGGVRAMAFHLGIMKALAEKNALEKVQYISSVSGGSLLIGLLFHHNGMRWPSSSEFGRVFDLMKREMCERSLISASLLQLLRPWNWQDLLSRSNLVAKALYGWGLTSKLGELPQVPEWSINGTTAENGRRFRFKRDSLGDYIFGYADAKHFPLAKAMAVSAAFPGGIGPLSFRTADLSWKKQKYWNSPEVEEVTLPFKILHLYDGGVYDNLGLEPYFDVGTRSAKIKGLQIYVSDAGAPLRMGAAAGALSPWRLKRVSDIMSEQSRALRVRVFINYIAASSEPVGEYVYIGTEPKAAQLYDWKLASEFKTNLNRLKIHEFDAISSHGYQLARETERRSGFLARI